jgi:nucleotide-binding universal stress UspA family protein
MKTILAATDFSPDSARALTHALRWASEWNGKVVLFHAVETPPPRMHGMIDLLPEFNPYFDKEVAEAWERIHQVIPEAARNRCELTYEVRQGNPREQILQYAQEMRPDLIVMGSRGSGRSSVVWGSTISGIVRDGRFPVLSLRHLRD